MNENMMFAKEDEQAALNITTDDMVDSQKYLIFMADHLKLGVVAEDVVEILNNQVITYLPMVPEYIRGIINMRGQMIPILDICSRMGLPSREEDSLVVVDQPGGRAAGHSGGRRGSNAGHSQGQYPPPAPPTARSSWCPVCAPCPMDQAP